MHRFSYKKKELYCEEVPLKRIAEIVGTPCYVYSSGTLMDHFLKLKKAFKEIDCLVCYSVKSNSNLTLMKQLVQAGAGLDIVSGGELYRANRVDVDPKKIVYASVGKTRTEIAAALKAGIGFFNVESISELELINSLAQHNEKIQDVAIRINPDVHAKTHKYISTGKKENKFGLEIETAFHLFLESYRYPFLRFAGIHIHVGSQITESKPFISGIRVALEFVKRLRLAGVFVDTLNIGGGLGIIYNNEKPQTAEQFARRVIPMLKKANLRLILEPGRFVSGQSGILLTKVLHWKVSKAKNFAIVDAGMNDLMRPSLYEAYHSIQPVVQKSSKNGKAKLNEDIMMDIVGPICESGDFLAKDRRMKPVKQGDLLAVMSCGAYGFVMASNYNSRPRVAEVVVKGRRFYVTKRRETYADLVQGEKVIEF